MLASHRFTAAFALLGPLLLAPTAIASEDKATPQDAWQLSPPTMPLARTSAADSTIAAMVAAVDESYLFSFLEKLTGEVTVDFPWGNEPILSRYSASRGQDIAAHFLGSVFEDFGYDVEFHYFRFDTNLQSIVVQPDGSGTAIGGKARILRTADSALWNRSLTGLETHEATFRELSRVSAQDWVVVGNDGVIVTSDDGAQSWTFRTSGTTERLDGVDVLASGAGWICGRTGTLLATTDSGVTWQSQTSGVSSFLYDIDALGDLTAVAVGGGGTILRTTDGGATWGAVSSGTTVDLLRADFVGNRGWAVGSSGTILTTLDGGSSWSAQTSGVTAALRGVSFVDASTGWAVGSTSAISRTTDGGASWTSQTSPFPGITLLAVHAVSAAEAWIGGFNGTLLRTTDGGSTWESRRETVQDGWVNVVAELPGTTNPSSEVILGGHYDSTSPELGDLAPGADDNGSGVATIVEAARQLWNARYERTIKFVLFSGEEEGLSGSAAYAQRAVAEGEQIHSAINLDSVGWNDDYFRIFSNDDSGWLGDITYQNAQTYAPTLTTFHWWCGSCNWSDHWSFWEQGFDAIVGIETWDPAPPQHHTVGDTLGLVDIPLVANVTRIMLSTVATLAEVDTTVETSVDPLPSAPLAALRLHPGVPNPSAGPTTFHFDVPRRSRAKLAVYDVGGHLVQSLDLGIRDPGRHSAIWDGRDGQGRRVASGVYFSRLEAAGETRTRPVTVLR